MKLEGEIISLRALEPSDADLLYKWENDTQVWQMSNTITPISKAALHNYITSTYDIYTEKQLRLMVVKSDSGIPIGTLDLFDCDFHHKRAGVGILIAESTDRQKGYASQALALLKDYCKNTLDMHLLFANILADNAPSIALFEKIGFENVGLKKEWIRDGEIRKDEYLYQCIL